MCEALLAVAGSSLKCVSSITSKVSVALLVRVSSALYTASSFLFFIRAAFENFVHSGGFLDGLRIFTEISPLLLPGVF